jgi:hypothetical protein
LLKPPYRNAVNARYTRLLFWEQWHVLEKSLQTIEPPFTLYDDKPGKINARTTFVELGDPTGYKWAIKYLGDYEHWKFLMRCTWFQEAYEVWLNELKMKIRSENLDIIREIAKNDDLPAQKLVAAKYLASFEWEKSSRGRPGKAELQGELKRAAQALEAEDDDWNRIKAVK